MAGWKDKRRVMRRYDLTADMYEERYGEEQGRNTRPRWKTSSWLANGFWMSDAARDCFSVKPRLVQAWLSELTFHVNCCIKPKSEAKKAGNVFVLQADADHLPFREGFFEAVFAFTVLQNMPKPEETLRELKRVTKPDGNVVVTGLKKAFPLDKFMDVLEGTSLQVTSFLDSENLKCYVAVLAAVKKLCSLGVCFDFS